MADEPTPLKTALARLRVAAKMAEGRAYAQVDDLAEDVAEALGHVADAIEALEERQATLEDRIILASVPEGLRGAILESLKTQRGRDGKVG